jgi:hypothetical protein
MLEVRGDDKRYLVMSAAHQSQKPKQIEQLEKHATILSSS